jgi:tetratricopeptide (TPR) repeat protein
MNIIRQYWLIITLIIVVFLTGSCNWLSKDKTDYTYMNNPDSIQSAISLLSKKIERKASNYKLLFDRAKLYEKTDKLQMAVNDMKILVQRDSVSPKYWNYLGDLFIKAGSAKGAVNCYLKSTFYNPQDEYAFSKLGELYLILQNYEKSFQNLNEALRINKYNPKIYFYKGLNYLEMKDTLNAISSFQTAVTVSPEYFDAHMNLGILYAAKKDKKAISYYQNALKSKANSIEALYALGKFYQDIDSFDKAVTEYNKILDQVPDHKSTNYNLGYISFLKGDFNRAIQYFSTAISKQPDYTDAYYGRGLCYKKTGKTDLAEKDFTKTIQLDPKYELAEKELKKLKKISD